MQRPGLVLLFLFTLSTHLLWAVPACPDWQCVVQPDGSVITLRQMGDECYHYWINRDGEEVVQNEQGYWAVSPVQITGTQRRARRAASPMYSSAEEIRKAATRPTRVLVILVNFQDRAMLSGHDQQFYDDLLNKLGSGSVREYFKQSSDSNYVPQFDVWGPVTTDSVMAYYGGNNANGDDLRAGCMIYEACVKVHDLGCNFANYDENNDGQVDNINVIFAGYSESSGGGADCIWPHQWNLKNCRNCGGSYYLDDKRLYTYSCSAELRGGSGTTSASIGTFCHEFSHILGMPDYYDTNYGYNHDNDMTPGGWSLMDNGNYNNKGQSPPLYSIFDKCYMGWASMPPLLAKDAQVTMTMPVGTPYCRHITGGTTPKNYTSTDTVYYIENRQKSGYFDKGLPTSGMLIWRVLYRSNWSHPNNDSCALRYTLVSASGSAKGLGTSKDPYPGSKSVTAKTLAPGCVFSQITNSDGNITFNFNGGSTTFTHQWMANGSLYATTTSRSSLTLPNSSPNPWSGVEFVGWTTQTILQKDGSDLILARLYDEVSANTTFYAVYRSTDAPVRYFYESNASLYAIDSVDFAIAEGQSVEIGGQSCNTPGDYPCDTIKTVKGDSVLIMHLSWVDPDKTIIYTGPNQLAEVTGNKEYGLHINAFGQAIRYHYFSNGIGIVVFNDSLTTVGRSAFYGCRKGLKNQVLTIQLPSTVRTIGPCAFYCCYEATHIHIPDGVTQIGDSALYKCQNLSSVCFPEGITRIGDRMFLQAYQLSSFTIPGSVTQLGTNVFDQCTQLTELTCKALTPPATGTATFTGITPADVVLRVCPSQVGIYSQALRWKDFLNIQPLDSACKTYLTEETAAILAGMTYPWHGREFTTAGVYYDSLQSIRGCDSICKLTLTIVDADKAIVYRSDKKLAEYPHPVDKNTLGFRPYKFSQSMLSHSFANGTGVIAFDNTVTQIGDSAFYGCRDGAGKMSSITLPDSITRIGNAAFYYCRYLTSLTIPKMVTSIGNRGIYRCLALQSITCEAITPPMGGKECLYLTPDTTILYVWPISQTSYQEDATWNYFSRIRRIPCGAAPEEVWTQDTIMAGESLEWRGRVYAQQGVYSDTTVTDMYGCDTTVYRLALTVLSIPTPISNMPQPNRDDDTRKLIHNDHLIIYRNGRYFDALGHPVPMD